VTASSRVVALDAILDAASRRRRKEMPGRYRYCGRLVTALVGLGQGLAAVAEAVQEADEHARRRANLSQAAGVDERELRAYVEAAWESGYARHVWEEHRFRQDGPAEGERAPLTLEEYLGSLTARRGVPPPPREGWQQ
jgi:hypothetical protein